MFAAARLRSALLALLLAACSSDDAGGGKAASGDAGAGGGGDAGGGGAGAACAELLPECLVKQQVCGVSAGEPRCEPCPPGQFADREAGACAALPGEAWSHDFADFTVGAAEEVLGLCQSWTVGNETELWVNAVELEQDAQSHHSNWLFVPANEFDGPDGVWPCRDRGYSQLQAALKGGVIYAQSTQAVREVQKFPPGAAVRLPPRSRIIGDVHLLNTTDEAVTGHARLTLHAIPGDDVSVKLAPFHLTYDTLAIPPKQRSRFVGECDIDKPSRDTLGRAFDAKLYFLLPHTHALGDRFFLEVFGGPDDGKSLFDVYGFDGEARGQYYEPAVDLAGATGFRFGCEFENPRDETIGWGFGDQEMCETLGFIASDIAFESRVSEVNEAPSADSVPTFTGACSTLAFPYSQEQPGGPPP
ncbi:MAG: hypothetical protein FJ104_01825 [Deltaproteobacteria bacterium]|nr:hypothetical protein [Deltaproteobacteria bacterium]